jgi:hypothetical protein
MHGVVRTQYGAIFSLMQEHGKLRGELGELSKLQIGSCVSLNSRHNNSSTIDEKCSQHKRFT